MNEPQSVIDTQAAVAHARPPLNGVRGYLFAVICLALALLVRGIFDPLWGDRLPYVAFFLAVLVVAHYAEIGPSIATIFVGFLLGDWCFVPPRHSLLISSPADRFNSVFFIFIGFVVLALSLRSRKSLGRERAAQEELRRHVEELARLAAIVESSDDAIIGKALDGTIRSWNAGAERVYGYSSSEALGKPIGILMPSDAEDAFLPLLERVRQGERISHFETARRAKDGRLLSVSLSISPVRDGRGNIVGASTIARDITKRKQAEAEQERLVQQLQAALAKVKTLSGLLPICAHCKKIRDDTGSWNQIEFYIRERSEADFTHGICPECARAHYPDLYPADPPTTL